MHRLTVLLVGILAVVAATTTYSGASTGRFGLENVEASTGGPEMVLNVKGGNCDDPVRPTSCAGVAGDAFLLSVDALGVPVSGYIGFQTAVDIGAKLVYKQANDSADEIVWPDGFVPLVNQEDTLVLHSSLSGFVPPLPVSTYQGNIVEFSLTCPTSVVSETTLQLLPLNDPAAGTSGSVFFVDTNIDNNVIPKLGSLTITCSLPTPTDTPTITPTPTDTFTPTNTPTGPTPTRDPAVGGISLDTHRLRGLPTESSAPASWLWAVLPISMSVLLMLGGGVLWLKRGGG